MQEVLKKIYEYSLSDIMGERFGAYSKYIIQDRAIPDARDGLKPVQRRILFSMYKDKNTYDKAYKKSATAVGNVMGKFHPHGDTPIYEAMARMSQDWKQNVLYIDMQGNNGSIDGDPPAAYRYTEARLSKISEELLKDLDRDTVEMILTFDDSNLEPTVLPAKYPNLLVNGSNGISAGYATNIAPHNLSEVIDATIKKIEKPNASIDDLLKYIKGPDFPTGAIACGIEEIKKAYKTGKGKIVVKAKVEVEKNKIIITEIPFEVNKALLVKKIDTIRLNKVVDGITEVRDETDKEGLRIVIELKANASSELILNYLYKNTDLQTTFHYNAVAIVNRTPKLLSLVEMLDAYIAHYKEVVIRRTKFDLNYANIKLHRVEGLVKCISILDEVIKVIRASKNKSDAKNNLVKEFDFSIDQAETIVMLQLYKLTNTDVVELEEELKKLNLTIAALNKILSEEDTLRKVMIEELKRIKKEFGYPRRTIIEEEVQEIKIDTKDMIQEEDVVVSITKDGYIKRSSFRSYNATEETSLKDNDYYLNIYKTTTLSTLIIFTSLGNYLYLPVHEIPNYSYKELGKHISNIITLEVNEKVVATYLVNDFKEDKYLILTTQKGMIKKINIKDLEVKRYSKSFTAIKLLANDSLIDVNNSEQEVILNTFNNYALKFSTEEIPVLGLKSRGVKAIKLDKDDYLVSSNSIKDETYIVIGFNNGTLKRLKLEDIKEAKRTNKGIKIIRTIKTNKYNTIKSLVVSNKDKITLIDDVIKTIKVSDIAIKDLDQTGTSFVKELKDMYKETNQEEQATEVDFEQLDLKLKNIDNMLKEI
ncbi:MAG: DNA topoisomerase IV subunit A [Clostridiales bacterium]|nr:DNA topoisomerase IV subunit A [Clostridiales bacterium]